MRLKAFPTAVLARLLPNDGAVKRIPAGSDPDARTTIVSSIRCDDPQWLDQEQKERAGLATVALSGCQDSVSTGIRPPEDAEVSSDASDLDGGN